MYVCTYIYIYIHTRARVVYVCDVCVCVCVYIYDNASKFKKNEEIYIIVKNAKIYLKNFRNIWK